MSIGNKKVMARNIQRYMDKMGIDRKKLCDDLGFKYTTVAEWLQGNAYPRIDKIEMMAKYFGCSKADLVEESTNEWQIILNLYNDFDERRKRRLLEYARMLKNYNVKGDDEL